MLDAVRRENQAAIDRTAGELRARQDAVDQALTGLSEQTRKIEAQNARAPPGPGGAAPRRVTGRHQAPAPGSRAALEDQERRFTEGQQERQERARETRELHDELAGIRTDRDRARAAAATLIADARLMRDAIDAELPHERFAPGSWRS